MCKNVTDTIEYTNIEYKGPGAKSFKRRGLKDLPFLYKHVRRRGAAKGPGAKSFKRRGLKHLVFPVGHSAGINILLL
jgi:hypothetical protein